MIGILNIIFKLKKEKKWIKQKKILVKKKRLEM